MTELVRLNPYPSADEITRAETSDDYPYVADIFNRTAGGANLPKVRKNYVRLYKRISNPQQAQ